MPLASTTARNMALDACYGDNRAAHWSATVRVRLFTTDPRAGGTELPAAGGYAAKTVNNTSVVFPDASGGIKTTAPIDFGTSTGAYGAVATWAVITHPTTGVHLDAVELDDDINVTAAGFGVRVVLEIAYDELTD